MGGIATLAHVLPILGRNGRMFYIAHHKEIYEACIEVKEHDLEIDITIVSNALSRRRKLEFVGGIDYLMQLVLDTPTHAHAAYYAELVRDAHVRHLAEGAALSIVQAARRASSVLDLERSALDAVRSAFRDMGGDNLIVGDQVLEIVDAHMQERAEDQPHGIRTGIGALDVRLGPLCSGLMYVLAPTSTGKTTLCLQMMRYNALSGARPVLYFNELDIRRVIRRLLVMESVDWQSWHEQKTPAPLPTFREYDIAHHGRKFKSQIQDARSRLERWIHNCTFVPAHGWTAPRIADHFSSLWMQSKCDQVYVDYLDLIPYESGENMSEGIGRKLATLRQAADMCHWGGAESGMPLVITGQTRKGFDDMRRPTMDDAFGSVRIQQYAYKFLTLWRERDQSGEHTGRTLVRIEKNPDDGSEGYEIGLHVAGNKEMRGFLFYPVAEKGEWPF